jgi:hypothetical protein
MVRADNFCSPGNFLPDLLFTVGHDSSAVCSSVVRIYEVFNCDILRYVLNPIKALAFLD